MLNCDSDLILVKSKVQCASASWLLLTQERVSPGLTTFAVKSGYQNLSAICLYHQLNQCDPLIFYLVHCKLKKSSEIE